MAFLCFSLRPFPDVVFPKVAPVSLFFWLFSVASNSPSATNSASEVSTVVSAEVGSPSSCTRLGRKDLLLSVSGETASLD